MSEEVALPSQWSHSVKITDTAKGIRLDVHVWANDQDTAVQEAFKTYVHAKTTAGVYDIPLAPIEIKEAVK